MPRIHVPTLVVAVLLLGIAAPFYRAHLPAQATTLPSPVTAGSCWQLKPGDMTFKIEAVEGNWVKTAKGDLNFLREGLWINLAMASSIRQWTNCP